MSLFNKIKDILFEEEETEEIKVVKQTPINKEIIEEYKKIEKNEVIEKENVTKDVIKENPFVEPSSVNNSSSFKFPEFDEEEFDLKLPRRESVKEEREETRSYSPRPTYKYDRHEKSETIEKKKFKLSPIISPVYGILNEDYNKDDIKVNKTEREPININVDEVRKKAFEPLHDIETLDDNNYESEDILLEEDIKMKTIDELLEEDTDLEIELEDELVINKDNNLDIINEELEKEEEIVKENDSLDDTLETDLFELIDSMYENREEGE